MKILLIRHAQSANNALPESERVPDPPLTALGQSQAEKLAEYLATLPIAQLYCSPFKRSLDTAVPTSRRLGLLPNIRADIYEQGGCYSGYEPGQLRGEPGMCCAQLGQLYPGWEIDPAIGPRGWNADREYETYYEVQQRAARVEQWLRLQWQPTRSDALAALIIHADFKRVLLAEMLQSEQWPESDQPIWNTGVSQLQLIGERWRLSSWNRTEHLPSEFRTPSQ